MTTKYQVTDSKGQVHKRTSKGCIYSAVVYHTPDRPSQVCWISRSDLAQKGSAFWVRYGWEVELIPVEH